MKTKTHILTFYDLGVGGIQTKLLSVANTLSARGHRVILILGQHVPRERVYMVAPKVQVVYPLEPFPWILRKRYYLSLLWYSCWYSADSLLVSLEDTSAFVLKWARYIPSWKTKIIVNYDLLPTAQQKLPTKQLSVLLNQADKVIAVSRAVYDQLVKKLHVSQIKVKYIPNWVDTTLYKKSHRKIRKHASMIFAGRLSPQKQPVLALRVFEVVQDTFPTASLAVYGEGELLNEVTKKAAESKADRHIHIYPPTNDIAAVLRESNFLLITSAYEGLPFIALEAMHHGCIVATLPFAGFNDIVQDEVTGLVGKTPYELAQKICALLTSPAKSKRIRQQAREAQETFFGRRALHAFIKEL